MSSQSFSNDDIDKPKSVASPAPLLRPPIPGANRTNGGARTPRLGLAIPPSPNQKPVIGTGGPPELQSLHRPSSRPAPPQLRLATPKGSNTTPQDGHIPLSGRLPASQYGGNSAVSGASETSAHSRSDSFTMMDERASVPGSASSSAYSAMSSTTGQRLVSGTPDPASAISSAYSDRGAHEGGGLMERNGSNQVLPDLDKLSLEKGRPLDIEDLDDDGWRAASEAKKIIEIGTLGEGAGGAVTKCKLQGGKTAFALKARDAYSRDQASSNSNTRSSQRTQIQRFRNRYFENLLSIKDVLPNTFADTMVPLTRAVLPR